MWKLFILNSLEDHVFAAAIENLAPRSCLLFFRCNFWVKEILRQHHTQRIHLSPAWTECLPMFLASSERHWFPSDLVFFPFLLFCCFTVWMVCWIWPMLSDIVSFHLSSYFAGMTENNSQYMYNHFLKYFHYSYTMLSLTFTEHINKQKLHIKHENYFKW